MTAKPSCSRCGGRRDRADQSYCRACHAAYQAEWRLGAGKKRLRALYVVLGEIGIGARDMAKVRKVMEGKTP